MTDEEKLEEKKMQHRKAAYNTAHAQSIRESANNAAIHTTLRAILLKLNSPEANRLLHAQVKDQIASMHDEWVKRESEHLNKCVSFFGEKLRDELKGQLSTDFFNLLFQAEKVLDGIFSLPEDVAGLL